MKAVEIFISEYFIERNLNFKKALEYYAPFLKKFYTDGFVSGDKRLAYLKEMLATSETVVAILTSSSKNTAKVIALRSNPAGGSFKLRYNLIANDDSWLIQCIEFECLHDQNMNSNSSCSFCGGTGWFQLSTKKKKAFGSARQITPPLPPDEIRPR